MTQHSYIYHGTVVHNRTRPRTHRLRYRMFWSLLDLDGLDALARDTWLFSYNRFNVFSFHDADHGDAGSEPLRVQIDHHLRAAGIGLDGGRIELLCMPRILGYQFNPISVYFCRRYDGTCAAILYEVHNTFGERHSYLFETSGGNDSYEHSCRKEFYVSPFLDMDMTYSFRVSPPADRVSVRIEGADMQGPLIVAALTGQRAPFSDAALFKAFFAYPLLTLKVIVSIHWHALRMLLRGFRLRARPVKPEESVSTIVARGAST